MAEADVTEDEPLFAGDFGAWLSQMQSALRGKGASDVPCDGCTACCRSSQFVHIEPDERDTLARIPTELLFPAPGLPRGNVLLGYDENGHCPMLVDDKCSIYDARPRTCRTYDCRVFPAAEVEIDDEKQLPIARRARRWQFGHPAELDQVQHDAVRAAARFVRDRRELLPEGVASATATQRALLAIRLHDAFLEHDDDTGVTTLVDPEPETVRGVLARKDPDAVR